MNKPFEMEQLVCDKNDPRRQVGKIEVLQERSCFVRWHPSYACWVKRDLLCNNLPTDAEFGSVLGGEGGSCG